MDRLHLTSVHSPTTAKALLVMLGSAEMMGLLRHCSALEILPMEVDNLLKTFAARLEVERTYKALDSLSASQRYKNNLLTIFTHNIFFIIYLLYKL